MLGLTWEKAGPFIIAVTAAAAAYWYGEYFFGGKSEQLAS